MFKEQLGKYAYWENVLIHLPADHSSISSRQRMGPPEGTRLAIALLTLYPLLWRAHMAWDWNKIKR